MVLTKKKSRNVSRTKTNLKARSRSQTKSKSRKNMRGGAGNMRNRGNMYSYNNLEGQNSKGRKSSKNAKPRRFKKTRQFFKNAWHALPSFRKKKVNLNNTQSPAEKKFNPGQRNKENFWQTNPYRPSGVTKVNQFYQNSTNINGPHNKFNWRRESSSDPDNEARQAKALEKKNLLDLEYNSVYESSMNAMKDRTRFRHTSNSSMTYADMTDRAHRNAMLAVNKQSDEISSLYRQLKAIDKKYEYLNNDEYES